MSTEATDWVFENSKTTGSERLALLALAFAADEAFAGAAESLDLCHHMARVDVYEWRRVLVALVQAERLTIGSRYYVVGMVP